MTTLRLNPIRATRSIVAADGRPDISFIQTLNNSLSTVVGAVNENATFVDRLVALNGLVTSAQTVASDAQSAADSAASQVAAQARLVALMCSFTVPSNVLSSSANATSATVSISAHSRRYANGQNVTVAAGTIAGLALSTTYWIYYSDAGHGGGSVAYHATTTHTDAAQIADVHCVGKIVTPAANLTSSGTGSAGPGVPL